MRLELLQTSGPLPKGERRRWILDRGRRTLGGGHECDWQLEADDRTLSPHHCMIESDWDGYSITDRSEVGTRVNSTMLRQGETMRLEHGAVIAFGPFAFEVAVFGEAEPDFADPQKDLRLSDEALTISSILSDLAPGRRSASGLTGGYGEDETSVPASEARRSWGAGDAPVPPSSRVEIGWDGPPAVEGTRVLLPSDWNDVAEPAALSSDLEHRAALSTVMPRLRGKGVSTPPFAGSGADRDLESDFQSLDEEPTMERALDRETEDHPLESQSRIIPASEVGGAAESLGTFSIIGSDRSSGESEPEPFGRSAFSSEAARGDLPFEGAPRVEALLRDCEDVLDELAALVGLSPASPSKGAYPGASQSAQVHRLEAILAREIALREQIERWLREIGQRLEPKVIEARVDAAFGSFLRPRQSRYWGEYRKQFHRHGKDLSVFELLRELTTDPR